MARVELPFSVAATTAAVPGLPQEKRLAGALPTVTTPDSPAVSACVPTTRNCVWLPERPKSVPRPCPVMPRLSYTDGSNASTGTGTWLNLLPTLPGATESEMTTRSLPLALAAELAESLTTVTTLTQGLELARSAAASPLETGTAPTTNSVSARAERRTRRQRREEKPEARAHRVDY